MRQYERNDVIVDQCTECGGIFLDRGELERLAQAEANYYNPQAAQPLPPRSTREAERDSRNDGPRYAAHDRFDERSRDGRFEDRRSDDHRSDQRYYPREDDRRPDERRYRDEKYDPRGSGKYGKKRKREGFFGDMLDLLGD